MKPFFLTLLFVSVAFALPAPFHFEPNQGQWEGEFAYRCDVGNASYFLTGTGMTIAVTAKDEGRRMRDEAERYVPQDTARTVRGHAVMVRLVGCNEQYELVPEDRLTSYSNYFKGRDQSQWKSRVPNYGRVIAKEVWPGIDVEYKADPRGVETFFHVKPGADVSRIVVQYEGLDEPLRMDGEGKLVLVTSVGDLYEKAPFAFQIESRRQASIRVQYRLLGNNRYGLICEEYNRSAELVIDPLVYSTYIAGSIRDEVFDMTKDGLGNKLIHGDTWRANFPTTPGAFQETGTGGGFLMKFSPNADSLIFSTYISGGSGFYGKVRTLTDNSIYIASNASSGWPLSPDAFDTVNASSELGVIHLTSHGDSLLFCTYLGGVDDESLSDCEVDSLGRFYISGRTQSSDFPVTPGAMWGEFVGIECTFLAIFDTTGALVYSTFYSPILGGRWFPMDLVVLSPGYLWIVLLDYNGAGGLPTTPDAFISETTGRYSGYFARVDLNSNSVEYASYLGAPHSGYENDYLCQIIVQGDDRLLLIGYTNNPNFPMPPGGLNPGPPSFYDGFILDFQLPNTPLRGTFFGGSDYDIWNNAYVESAVSILIPGITHSGDLPVTPDAYDSTLHPGEENGEDLFLCRLSSDFTALEYCTYIGGEYDEWTDALVYDHPGAIWLAGHTFSNEFPITSNAMFPQPSTGFLLRMDLSSQSARDPFIPQSSSFTLSTYPNPFNPTATLSFTLPHSAPVTVSVYNVLGQTVYEENLGRLNAGEHRHLFDASELPSGVYLSRVQAGERSQVRKIVLLK